jgi:hypothetical protein
MSRGLPSDCDVALSWEDQLEVSCRSILRRRCLGPLVQLLNSFVGIIESVRTGTHDPFVGFKNSCRIDSLCYSQVVHVLVIAGAED